MPDSSEPAVLQFIFTVAGVGKKYADSDSSSPTTVLPDT